MTLCEELREQAVRTRTYDRAGMPLALLLERAANENDRLRAVLSRWVTAMDLAGTPPVSGDLRDHPVLALLTDSRELLKPVSLPHMDTCATKNGGADCSCGLL